MEASSKERVVVGEWIESVRERRWCGVVVIGGGGGGGGGED